MAIITEFRDRARHALPSVIAASVVAYFLFHALQGDRGLVSYLRLNGQIEATTALAEQLAAERRALEKRVTGLNPKAIDPDLLEERAKAIGFLRKGEWIITLEPAAQP